MSEKDAYSAVVKKTIKKVLSLSNYFVLESNGRELGYYGSIAYEARFDEL